MNTAKPTLPDNDQRRANARRTAWIVAGCALLVYALFMLTAVL